MMEVAVSADADVNRLFGRITDKLAQEFEYEPSEAERLARSYYMLFTSEEHCRSLGIPVQDDDFFFHEAAGGMALRIHYYLGLRGDPDPDVFTGWRARRFKSLHGMS